MKRKMILDCDTGHDDAIALMVASKHPDIELLGVTVVAGNQTLPKTLKNTLNVADHLGLNVPVYGGMSLPLVREQYVADDVHGETGLDGPALPEPDHELSSLSAPEMMAKVLQESEEKVTIISTGAQTNVAALLLSHPELKEKIEMVSTMGGGLRNGNWTSGAEFNILVDPEAAHIVYHSGVPLQMCGLDVTEKALVYPEDWERIRALNNPVARIVAEWFDFFFIHVKSLGWSGATTHDPCAVMSLLHPEIFDIRDYYVDVELNGKYMRGATIADYNGILGKEANCHCVVDLDREKFVDYLIQACAKFEGWEVNL